MRIAILYICTGKYNQFFDGFYQSSEKFFLAGKADKDYFVWTDDDSLGNGRDNVYIYHKDCAGFPADSLFRFDYFLQAEEKLREYDYIYFFNANAEFKQKIDEDILPDETGLAMGRWYSQEKHWWSPWRLFNLPAFYCYERNKKSLAYIPPFEKNYKEYMGGINGGRTLNYLQMIKTLAENIRDDYERGIIAVAHDQSHINAYMRTHSCKDLSKEYCWPEEWPSSFAPKIIFRDKKMLGGDFLKGRQYTRKERVQRVLKRIINAIKWYVN